MNKEKRRVPKLRFPGFAEDWEQRKLGDYLSIPEKEILEVKSANDLLTVKLNLGGVELGASRDTLSLGSTVYYKRYAGQFIYGKQNFFNGSMGIIPQKLDGKGSSGDVPSFNISNIEANYLYAYVSRESYWRPKVAAASGTGSKRIHEKTLLDFNIDIPSINEQKLISNTFDLINRFITLHQRKLEHLNLKKKALLQKLFPKNGERHPELRFPGFTDAWEQRKLSEVVTINPKTELPDEFKYVDLESVVGTNLLGFKVIKKENAPSRAQRLAFYGDVFYQTVRPYQRNNYLFENVDKDVVFSTGYAQLRSKLDSYFLLTLVQNDNFVKVVLDNCTGTSYPAINGSELGKITVQIPSNEVEANQIGKVFRGIDKSITLHQRKLEHLQLQKKALLQQMFV